MLDNRLRCNEVRETRKAFGVSIDEIIMFEG